MPLYAEQLNYWKTGTSSPDTWLERTKAEIQSVGGVVSAEGIVTLEGRSAVLLAFTLGGMPYRINWPVLDIVPRKKRTDAQRKTDERSAKIQAATFLYHDIKARCMVVKIMGATAAFVQYAMLPTGETLAEMGFKGRGAEVPQALLRLTSGG
jgi:hypothetical protein